MAFTLKNFAITRFWRTWTVDIPVHTQSHRFQYHNRWYLAISESAEHDLRGCDISLVYTVPRFLFWWRLSTLLCPHFSVTQPLVVSRPFLYTLMLSHAPVSFYIVAYHMTYDTFQNSFQSRTKRVQELFSEASFSEQAPWDSKSDKYVILVLQRLSLFLKFGSPPSCFLSLWSNFLGVGGFCFMLPPQEWRYVLLQSTLLRGWPNMHTTAQISTRTD